MQTSVVEGTVSYVDKVDTSGKVGDCLQEAGNVEVDLKGDGKKLMAHGCLLRGKKQELSLRDFETPFKEWAWARTKGIFRILRLQLGKYTWHVRSHLIL